MKPLQRVNDSMLGVWERPALSWMAERLPDWVAPDHLTLLGVFGALLTACGYGLSRGSLHWLWLACVGLIANWAGDSLDGTLARLRDIERPRFGFFIDHTSDLFCQVLTFLSLGVSPLVHFSMACLALITFLMAFVYTLITAQTHATMRITYFFFGPSEIRTLLLFGNLLTLAVGIMNLRTWIPALPGSRPVFIHDVFIAVLCVAGIIVIGTLALRDGRALSAEDPLRR